MKRRFIGPRLYLTAAFVAGGLLLLAISLWYRADYGPTTGASEADMDGIIHDRGAVTFRSWNGKWIGSDSDSDITFLPGSIAYLTEYGAAVVRCKGTYSIDPEGRIE